MGNPIGKQKSIWVCIIAANNPAAIKAKITLIPIINDCLVERLKISLSSSLVENGTGYIFNNHTSYKKERAGNYPALLT